MIDNNAISKQQVADKLDLIANKDLLQVMSTDAGRRLISWIIYKCGQNQTSFTGNSWTYFNEGKRSIALMLEATMKFSGMPGVDMMLTAEKEWIEHQAAVIRDLEIQQKKASDRNGQMQRRQDRQRR